MARVIAVAASKGGVGKSMLATNLAVHLLETGRSVLLVDADPQGTCRIWADHAANAGHEAPVLVAMGGPALKKDLKRVAAAYDIVIVDSPSRVGPALTNVMMVADFVLMPCSAGPSDLWALQQTLEVLQEVQGFRSEIRAAIVLNKVDVRTNVGDATCCAAGKLGEEFDVKVLSARISSRVAFPEAMAGGQGVTTYAPSSPAAEEVRAVTRRVLAQLEVA